MPHYVTVAEAAAAMRCSPRRVYQLIADGTLAAVRFSRVWQVDSKHLRRVAASPRPGPGRPKKAVRS